VQDDGKPDPRFAATADQLKKQGVEDYQLHYALKTSPGSARSSKPRPAACRRRAAGRARRV
jgi:carboxyl-terminal processing protease